MVQEVITYSIGVIALVIIARWLYRSLQGKSSGSSGCTSCEGCTLCDEKHERGDKK